MDAAGAPTPACSDPLQVGEAVLIKGVKSDRLCAIDPDRMKVVWDRADRQVGTRCSGSTTVAVYLGGPELGALDLQTRTLLWTTRLPGGSTRRRACSCGADGLWQLTPRGIFEVDPAVGPGPADLPRAGLRRGRRRPALDRPLAPGDQQSHDLGVPARSARGREDRPRGHGGTETGEAND